MVYAQIWKASRLSDTRDALVSTCNVSTTPLSLQDSKEQMGASGLRSGVGNNLDSQLPSAMLFDLHFFQFQLSSIWDHIADLEPIWNHTADPEHILNISWADLEHILSRPWADHTAGHKTFLENVFLNMSCLNTLALRSWGPLMLQTWGRSFSKDF